MNIEHNHRWHKENALRAHNDLKHVAETYKLVSIIPKILGGKAAVKLFFQLSSDWVPLGKS